MLDRKIETPVVNEYAPTPSTVAQSPLEGIQNAHQTTREAIDSEKRDRTFRTYEEAEELNSGSMLHALKNILSRLDRIESLIRGK